MLSIFVDKYLFFILNIEICGGIDVKVLKNRFFRLILILLGGIWEVMCYYYVDNIRLICNFEN